MNTIPLISPDVRLPPHNAEAEMAFIGALLANNAAYDAVAGFLRSHHFSDPAHARIYEAAAKLIEGGTNASPITLKAYFEHDEALAEIGGASYLASLANAVLITGNADDLGRIVFEYWQRREGVAAAQDLFASLHHDEGMAEPGEIIERHMADLDALAAGQSGKNAVSIADAVAIRLAELAQDRQDDAISTGLAALDEMTGGLFKGEPVLLAGRPAMGKTGCAITIAVNMAIAGHKVLFFSLEETQAGIINRVLARFSGIGVSRFRKGDLDVAETALVSSCLRHMDRLPLTIDAGSDMTAPAVRSAARSHQRKHGLDVVIVDHLRLIRPVNPKAEAFARINEASEGMKALAKELDVAVLGCMQLNRGPENREDKRPNLADLRQSGQLEEDARLVMFLYREAYYEERNRPQHIQGENSYAYQNRLDGWMADINEIKGEVELIVAKQNNGPTGTIKLGFVPETTVFRDLETTAPLGV